MRHPEKDIKWGKGRRGGRGGEEDREGKGERQERRWGVMEV